MLGRLSTVAAAFVALVTFATGLSLSAPAAGAVTCPDPFDARFRDAVSQQFPGQRVTAAVHDTRTGCWFHLHHGMQIQTASVIKAQFLAGVLLRAQEAGRGLSAWERDRIAPMMSFSHNPPASDLFISTGGVAGQEALDTRFGLTATSSTSRWGATVSTAEDRTKLALALLHAGGPLSPQSRAEAWSVMTAVHPTQRWGITAGVPSGWTVALKNGFYPTTGTPRWRIGSSGFVRHDASGEGYAITVMSDRNPDHDTGQRLVELVSRHVAGTLTDGDPAPRPVDRSQCVRTSSGESWSGVAARLGTTDVTNVRIVSGGPTSPLGGMRACRPELRAAFDPGSPSADFVRAAYGTFLGREPSAGEHERDTLRVEGGGWSRLDLAHALSSSPEWVGRRITDLYRSAFAREPDEAGLGHWRRRVADGLRLRDVGSFFYGSDEFFQDNGGTLAGYVDALYRELLHRPSDPAGREHWVDRLQEGAGRIQVAAQFYASLESRRNRIDRMYEDVLGRPADAAGREHWAQVLTYQDDVRLAAHLAASVEYFRAAQG